MLCDPRNWPGLLRWLLRGRAALKSQVAARAALNPTLLPYENTLIEYLREQRRSGRLLVLATAADRHVAESINSHLRLFDEVIASDGLNNLKGHAKADALVARFGDGTFTYIGNSWPDLHIWRRAGSAVLVNAPSRLADKVARITTVEHSIDGRTSRVRSLIKALRPHQWIKNALVFLPIVTANALRDSAAWLDAAAMFAAFSAIASAGYIVNDLTDLSADRAHPRKRRRPFASGDLPLVIGLALVPLLSLVGIALGFAIGTAQILVFYAAGSLVYSLKLKDLPLVDIFILASLYTVRIFGGAEATHYRVSPWLLAFSMFLFLGLASIKRVGELMDLKRQEVGTPARRGYQTEDVTILQAMGVSAGFVSTAVLALFVQSEWVSARYQHPDLLWAIVPLVLFWQCRLWLSTARGYMHDDPIIYAARDRVSWIVVGIGLFIFLLARGLSSPVG
jgi:4-hydroxybenzoate polyprenyltransferase